ncbi:hypothetical protein EK21DRAFT_88360 [Setomelanomma holmii]|uniref:Uncharacterized protein n=1 Tax=Setomelanomma holmii TaxID=210430 RepID=A0A9P4HC70_9PLEO|nr:hypothetical protein EK21DRAFT_88360 [Setomelanomma holmii]
MDAYTEPLSIRLRSRLLRDPQSKSRTLQHYRLSNKKNVQTQIHARKGASRPQETAITQFSDHVRTLYRPFVHSRTQAALGNARLRKAIDAYKLWVQMHDKLQIFRAATKYDGMASGWNAHKQAQRTISWKKAYVPALSAYRQLRLFVEEIKKQGEWPEVEEDFAAELADFDGTVLEAPGVQPEDLVDGFKEYNIELLAWFSV